MMLYSVSVTRSAPTPQQSTQNAGGRGPPSTTSRTTVASNSTSMIG